VSEAGATAVDPDAPLFGPEHDDYRESFRTFCEREVKPAYGGWAGDRRIPPEIFGHAGEQGYLGMCVPEDNGGLGIDDPRFGAVIGEEAMRAGAPALALALTMHSDVALPAILRGAPEDWQREHLPGLASGERLATVVRGEIELKGEALSGEARMVINGTAAEDFVVVCSTGDGERALALISSVASGFSVEPSDPPIGLDPAGLATVRFDGAQATRLEAQVEALEADEAFALAATAVAGTRAALAITTEYVSDRRAFGIPIADFQNTRRVIAEVTADADVAEAFVERALRLKLAGSLDPRTAAVAKLFCTELYGRAVDTGLQLHGGYGYIMEYEIAHAFADARFWRLAGTPNQRAKDAIGASLFE
jgi:long-chain-acyl-CoA dehydrogenase